MSDGRLVLHLTSGKGLFGAEKVMFELCRALAGSEFGTCVGILERRGAAAGVLTRAARHYRVAFQVFRCAGRIDWETVLEIRRFVRERRVDVVHSHGYKSDVYGLIATAGVGVGRVATCHNWLGVSAQMRLYRRLDKFLLRRFDRVALVSRELRAEVLYAGIAPEKAVVVANGIEPSVGSVGPARLSGLRAEFGLPATAPVLTAVGRLIPEKGFEHLIAAVRSIRAAVPAVRLLIIGDGPLKARLESAVLDSGLSGVVTIAGHRDDVRDILALTAVFVMPSLTEGMPLALLEAMGAGLPVVASAVGSIPEMIEDGRSGVLVGAGDETGLSAAVCGLLADRTAAAALGRAAQVTALTAFSAAAMADSYQRLYREVLAGRGKSREH